MKKYIRVLPLLLLPASNSAYGEEQLSEYDFSYTTLYGINTELIQSSSLVEPDTVTFVFSSDDQASFRERLERFRPRWQWWYHQYHFTLTLSEDEDEYVTIDIRF